MNPKCRNCFYWQHDMDSEYCAHPKIMEVSWAGLNPDIARKDENLCGKEGRLFKQTEVRELV